MVLMFCFLDSLSLFNTVTLQVGQSFIKTFNFLSEWFDYVNDLLAYTSDMLEVLALGADSFDKWILLTVHRWLISGEGSV